MPDLGVRDRLPGARDDEIGGTPCARAQRLVERDPTRLALRVRGAPTQGERPQRAKARRGVAHPERPYAPGL